MTVEKMMKDVIKRYGLESKEAIEFCRMCEKYEQAKGGIRVSLENTIYCMYQFLTY